MKRYERFSMKTKHKASIQFLSNSQILQPNWSYEMAMIYTIVAKC